MSLQLTHTLPSGVEGNFWKVQAPRLDVFKQTVCIDLFLFKDSTYKDGGAPISVRKYEFTNFASYTGVVDIRAVAYSQIKALTNIQGDPDWTDPSTADDVFFEGAVDV